jgi:hypothetical protein
MYRVRITIDAKHIVMTEPTKGRTLKIFGREIPMPASRIGRIILGVVFVFLGLLGFLPILGFWMVPVGLLILSQDLAIVRRWRRRFSVWYAKRKSQRASN